MNGTKFFDSLLDETLTSPSSVPSRHVQGMQSIGLKPKGRVVSKKIRGLGFRAKAKVKSDPSFWEYSSLMGLDPS